MCLLVCSEHSAELRRKRDSRACSASTRCSPAAPAAPWHTKTRSRFPPFPIFPLSLPFQASPPLCCRSLCSCTAARVHSKDTEAQFCSKRVRRVLVLSLPHLRIESASVAKAWFRDPRDACSRRSSRATDFSFKRSTCRKLRIFRTGEALGLGRLRRKRCKHDTGLRFPIRLHSRRSSLLLQRIHSNVLCPESESPFRGTAIFFDVLDGNLLEEIRFMLHSYLSARAPATAKAWDCLD